MAPTQFQSAETNPDALRAKRAAIIAQASGAQLKQSWDGLKLDPVFEHVRGPETGLVALKGRIGGGGAAFPFSDATATRTSVRLESGHVGHAIVLGRDKTRATIAAVVDALCQNADFASQIDEGLIDPLSKAIDVADASLAGKAEATRVDFFTMVRGED